tara:strand:- start:291 stop:884 length:594 start_codon:yes stop_codon:yes gene_type:complete
MRTYAHGGVVYEEDQCVLKLAFLEAHFTGFQISDANRKEFCEDLPKAAETLFVIEYLHDYLSEMLVEFRIIRDVAGFGVYADMDDIRSLGDLSQVTEFLLPFANYPDGIVLAKHTFGDSGDYIGVVRAKSVEADIAPYEAAFYFRVGGRSYWQPLAFIVLLVALHISYKFGIGTLGSKRMPIRKQELSKKSFRIMTF